MSSFRASRAFTLLAAAAVSVGLVAVVPTTAEGAGSAACGRASGCTKFELVSAASTYDWWPWASDPKTNVRRFEFRTQDGDKPPAGWFYRGAAEKWVVGAAGNGTLAATAAQVDSRTATQDLVTYYATGRSTGRWEIRFRSQTLRNGQTTTEVDDGMGGTTTVPYGDYKIQAELVPSGQAPRCGARSITMVTYDPATPTIARIGLTRFNIRLGAFLPVPGNPLNPTSTGWKNGNDPATSGWHVWAVEVASDHISWFMDGKVVRRETRKPALFYENLLMRVSLLSTPGKVTASTRTQMDWARYFTLTRTTKNKALVKQLTSAPKLGTLPRSVNLGC